MGILRIEWEAEASGIHEIDLDEAGLTNDEWNSFSYDEQLEMVTEALEEEGFRPRAEPQVWEIIEDEC